MDEKKMFYCSFCGKNQKEVSLIIAGMDSNICCDCVVLCVEVIVKKGLNKTVPLTPFQEPTNES